MYVVGTLILQAHVVKCNAHSFTSVLHSVQYSNHVVIVTIPRYHRLYRSICVALHLTVSQFLSSNMRLRFLYRILFRADRDGNDDVAWWAGVWHIRAHTLTPQWTCAMRKMAAPGKCLYLNRTHMHTSPYIIWLVVYGHDQIPAYRKTAIPHTNTVRAQIVYAVIVLQCDLDCM